MKTEEFKKLGAILDPRKAYVEFAERITGTLFTPERIQKMSDGLSSALTTAIDNWSKTKITGDQFNQLLKTANEAGATAYVAKLNALKSAGEFPTIGMAIHGGLFGAGSLSTPVVGL